MTNVTSTVKELPESRVRVEVQVPVEELDRKVAQTARSMGKEMKMAGFRKGKIPAEVVIQRIGREAVVDETIRSALGQWYSEAVDQARLAIVGQPEVELGELPAAGEPLEFSFEIGVRPVAKLGKYKGLKVERREPAADAEAIDAQIEEMRERMASLEAVEEAAGTGDFVVMNYVGSIDGEVFEGGEGTDQLIELGSGRLIPGFEEQLEGIKAGDERTVKLAFPDDYQAEQLAGKDAEFAVTATEIRRRVMPELNDDFANDAAGLETLAELREDLATRMLEADADKAEEEYREAVLEAVAEKAKIDLPKALVEARAAELLDRMLHQLSHQGISREMYFQISGRTEEEMLAESAEAAEKTIRHEAALVAVVEAEAIEPGDGDILSALQASAVQEETTPEKLRDRLESAGRLDDLIDELSQRQALDLIVESAVATSPS
ncbi:MAG: trigger factor [Actinobacteria bacterium]|uniref:peptidylprolyl isomerase n=1 Tax=freshwater metagenome TaxID=449393 RepID=A0A6J5ZD56_9ZZZZ|nr:trigger factor [Actinomycetota bacterium]